MSTASRAIEGTGFKAGWIILLGLSGLAFLNHAILIFVMDEPVLFIGWAAFNAYSTLVLVVPFRRGERWAWYITWLLAIAFASTALFDAEIAPYYLGAAVVMTVGLLLTRPALFMKG